MNEQHFEELREKINTRLEEIRAPYRRAQIKDYPWLYGALGEVPSDFMFICENPSLAGVTNAAVDTVDGGPPDIEAQWWGGAKNPAAKRFRVALHQLGLKESPPHQKGGWRCYITNVIKEMNVAGDQSRLPLDERRHMARKWAPVLAWELEAVKPKFVFCVGTAANELVTFLVDQKHIPRIRPRVVTHYSARTGDAAVIEDIVKGVKPAVAQAQSVTAG